MPDDEDDYESAFSLDGIPDLDEDEKEYEPGKGTWADLAKVWAVTLIFCAVSFGLAQPILQVCSILFLIVCCYATYNSLMYPEKYIVGNIVPGDRT